MVIMVVDEFQFQFQFQIEILIKIQTKPKSNGSDRKFHHQIGKVLFCNKKKR